MTNNVTPRELKTYVHTKICTQMFTAAAFIIAPKWKQSKCPLTDEWIKKMWYIYTMEYYSATKRNKILINIRTWRTFKTLC